MNGRRASRSQAAWFAAAALLSLPVAQAQQERAKAADVLKGVMMEGSVRATVDITRKENELLVETADRSLPVANPEVISLPVKNLPAATVLSFDQTTQQLKIESVALSATTRWAQLSVEQKSRYADVTAAHEALDNSARRAFSMAASDAGLAELSTSVQRATRAVVDQYGRLSSPARGSERALVEAYGELRRTGKAFYGYDDRYPPAAYESIYMNRVAAFAIARRGDPKSLCSGTLIGEDLALTNHHCISRYLADDLEARFDYEVDLVGESLPQQIFPINGYLISTADERRGLDFALLQLGANAEGRLAGAVYRPACLSMSRVLLHDPLYLIGHPSGEARTVHDNAYVFFPFRVTEDEYHELELLVRAEFLDKEDETEQLASFQASYRQSTVSGAVVFENFSTRWGQQPTIGADFDAFHGNSGSPAFNRRTHRVIGLLFNGEEDLSEPLRPGWRAHEAILPITVIIQRLDAVRPQWRGSAGICVQT